MRELRKSENWIAGLQWLFFIFTNTVVIPITVGAAFGLSQGKIVTILQLSFIFTGLACVTQAFLGHRRSLMEGQSGLWWGIILSLSYSAHAQGLSLETLGGSLAVGIIISGILTVFIGLSGLGQTLSKLFNSGVMGVFMFLFGSQLISIFLKGMLGIPFGNQAQSVHIDLAISLLSIVIAILVIVITVKAPSSVSRYALLIGIIIGWICFVLFFHQKAGVEKASFNVNFFPLGSPSWNTGIIITAVITGLLNTANTFGALKGSDDLYHEHTTKRQYRASFTISGIFVMIAGLFGMVPYAPYVSSIGFLSQTTILKRIPFVLGGLMFIVMGLLPPVGHFFSGLPLSIGSAVLFVAYLQLLKSSLQFFSHIPFNAVNIYRSAIPLFVGVVIMTLPSSYFETIPSAIRPFLSSGLLVGIILALFLENLFPWDRFGASEIKK